MGKWFASKRSSRVVAVCAAVATSLGVLITAGTAHSTIILSVQYPVTGTTYIKATNSTMSLGPGTLDASLDDSGSVTASVNLPTSKGSFTEFGVIPVSVKVDFIEASPTIGSVDLNTGAVQTTSHMTIRLHDLKVAGIPTPVGDHCETETPATISVSSGANWDIVNGGDLSGTYTIPNFQHCLLATPLINLVVPGPNNTIKLTLGPATVPSSATSATAYLSKLFSSQALQ